MEKVKLYYYAPSFADNDAARRHFLEHWVHDDPAAVHVPKNSFQAACFIEGKWKLCQELRDYRYANPAIDGAIAVCVMCQSLGLVKPFDWMSNLFIHVSCIRDGAETPLLFCTAPRDTSGLIDASS